MRSALTALLSLHYNTNTARHRVHNGGHVCRNNRESTMRMAGINDVRRFTRMRTKLTRMTARAQRVPTPAPRRRNLGDSSTKERGLTHPQKPQVNMRNGCTLKGANCVPVCLFSCFSSSSLTRANVIVTLALESLFSSVFEVSIVVLAARLLRGKSK